MNPVPKNKLFVASVHALTQAWDQGRIRGQSYANAVATLAMYMRKHNVERDVVCRYTLRVIQEDKTCLLD
jgi:hypothetical protein